MHDFYDNDVTTSNNHADNGMAIMIKQHAIL